MDELSQALELTSDAIQEDADILKGIVNFGNLTAAGVMTSRLDMVTLDSTAQFDKVIDCIVEHEYSRIPILQGSIDNIRGVLYAKDLIPHLNKGPFFKWQTLIRQPYFVPETMKLDDLLQEFQKNKIHIAVVVDEFGGTSGMVTLEDVLEEIVGEISDEYDVDNSLYTKQNDGSYVFEAKIMLTDFFRATDIDSEDFEFAERVVGGSVPKNFFPAVEKGLREAILKGPLAGYPVVGLRATLYDGSSHPVDSNEMAFKTAAKIAFKNGMAQASPVILEPIGELKVYMPDINLGDIMGDVTKRRGRVLGMGASEEEPKYQELVAEVPMAEMSDFAIALRSVTAGRGYFTLDFARYEDAPPHIKEKVIAEAKLEDDDE